MDKGKKEKQRSGQRYLELIDEHGDGVELVAGVYRFGHGVSRGRKQRRAAGEKEKGALKRAQRVVGAPPDAKQGRISIREEADNRRSSEPDEARPMARWALAERLRLRLRPRWIQGRDGGDAMDLCAELSSDRAPLPLPRGGELRAREAAARGEAAAIPDGGARPRRCSGAEQSLELARRGEDAKRETSCWSPAKRRGVWLPAGVELVGGTWRR